jgi:hypothetical protein
MLLPDRGLRRISQPYGAFAGGVNRLAEYAARVFGETTGAGQRILLEILTLARTTEATKTATEAAVKALTLDVFRSGSNKAALNFEVASDKASLHLHRFVRVVACSGTKSSPQSHVYHDGDSNDKDDDYRAEGSIPSGPSDNDSEEVAWSQRKSAYSVRPADKGRKTTAVNRHDNDREDEVPTTQRGSSSCSAPVAAASQDAIPTSSASSVATTADNGSKHKLTAVTTASRRKKTASKVGESFFISSS